MSQIKVDRWQFRDGTTVGTAIQTAYSQIVTSTTTTTTIPLDDTIPQSTEGAEFLTVTITPKKIGNVLRVQAIIFFGLSGNSIGAAALFKNSDASAVAAVAQVNNTAVSVMTLNYYETITSLTAITFKVRCGPTGAVTFRINGGTAARVFGGVTNSSITVQEIQAG